MNEFFVGQFRVDMGRSEIIAQDSIVPMEPRVLKVLLILAKHQGDVVTHQQILDSVWQDVKVGPNTLQRCITQLRKALGDDAKLQRVIKTHPKMGYSLVADVQWQEHLTANNQQSASEAKTELKPAVVNWRLITFAMLLLSMGVYGLWYQQESPTNLPTSKLSPLTTTDKKEFSPTYSPDGRYIAFQRYVALCENELWAKDLVENREYLLTKNSGIYGTPSWSPNGQNIAFSNVTHCSLSDEFQGCKDIRSLSFALAKSEPQEARVLMACENEDLSAAVWLTDQKVAFFSRQQAQPNSIEEAKQRVVSLDLATDEVEELYQGKNINLQSLSYSPVQGLIAITQYDTARKPSMVLHNIAEKTNEQVELQPPTSYKNVAAWSTNWHPFEASLIASKGNSLFEIDLQGQYKEYPIPTMQSISDPYFHPNGKSIVASMGIFDKDAKILSWGQANKSSQPYQAETIHRSILSEREAKFAPNSNRLAYISENSGTQQIWLSAVSTPTDLSESVKVEKHAYQLSKLTGNPQVYSFVWSFDGNLIIALINGKLTLLNLDGQTTSIDTVFEVVDIYQSPLEDKVLLEVVEEQTEKVVIFDLKTQSTQVLYQGDVHWGQLSDSNELYIANSLDGLSRVSGGIATQVIELNDLDMSTKFLYRDGKLVLTGRDNSIWIFDLKDKTKQKLFKIVDVLKHLDDIDFESKRLLMTSIASTKNEIILFHN